ncbi:hypothetical protein F3Y22_tig00000002pilonHSYRG00363 [Hibiscus syriacus]|uniref:Uncharacterized protein n=1 Tax=Hibiscus syriacus TaxID=106335 RepID=A0A6A3D7J7_HIBSY|nr:hypothetical protein F3Y22_tig00000002pilonHSYRG00363 [Hibiscus syriacus]
MRPYPRKSVAILKGIFPFSQPERSPSPNHLVPEQDNKKSPSSVLSSFLFDAMGSTASEKPTKCSSPTSCATANIQSLDASPVGKENDCVTSTEEENESLSTVKVSGHSTEEVILSLKSNANFEEPVCAKGNAEAVDMSFTSIKLLGITVEVKDSGNNAVGERLVQALSSTCLDLRLSHGTVINDWSRVPSKSNLSPCIEIHSDKNDRVEYTNNAPVPWWALYQVSETENRDKNSDSVDSQCQKSSPEMARVGRSTLNKQTGLMAALTSVVQCVHRSRVGMALTLRGFICVLRVRGVS